MTRGNSGTRESSHRVDSRAEDAVVDHRLDKQVPVPRSSWGLEISSVIARLVLSKMCCSCE